MNPICRVQCHKGCQLPLFHEISNNNNNLQKRSCFLLCEYRRESIESTLWREERVVMTSSTGCWMPLDRHFKVCVGWNIERQHELKQPWSTDQTMNITFNSRCSQISGTSSIQKLNIDKYCMWYFHIFSRIEVLPGDSRFPTPVVWVRHTSPFAGFETKIIRLVRGGSVIHHWVGRKVGDDKVYEHI